ncbi:MAG: helix-turn-helix transcriptional regulator [Oscillospiraceae bacterium]|nr:helix-turn-helix transcriptional regulator [Oscillospiraceae bacterium]
MELGKKIAHLRTQKGISQEKLAEMLDVTRQAVTKWENGKSNPDTENLIRLAEIFGCSLNELCGIETESKKQEPKIHIGGHILAAVSVLFFIGYCVIGGISGNFSGDILILLLIITFPMHVFLHLVFWGMVKSGEFSFLAGYDPDIKYNIDGMRRYIAGLDFMLGFETASYLFLMAASSLIVPEFEIAYILLIGYICGFFDAQTIPLMEASAGWHSPVSRIVDPLATVLFSAWIWMDFTGWVTRILKVSVASGLSALVMVMSHSPRCIALSALLFITLATPSSSVVNRTVLLLASIGVHTAERLTVDPAATAMTLYSSSSSSNGVIAGSSGS